MSLKFKQTLSDIMIHFKAEYIIKLLEAICSHNFFLYKIFLAMELIFLYYIHHIWSI